MKIISEEDYAERIRSKVQLREFTARYRALVDAIRASREALDQLDQAADLGDEKAFDAARKKAEAAHDRAEKLAEKLAKDFKAFAMEQRLAEAAQEAAKKLAENKTALSKLDFSSGEAAARRAIAEMKEKLGGVEKQIGRASCRERV